MMNFFKRMMKTIDPLKDAKRKGMHVGKNVTLASRMGSSFGSEPYLIFLDDEVRMSGGVHFVTHDGGTWAFRDLEQYKENGNEIAAYGSIHVGVRSFIGYGAIIMPGVHIGKRCVIGAGAVVTKDIPDEMVAVGCPAHVIGSVYTYAEKCQKKHLLIGYDIEELQKNKRKYLEGLAEEGAL